MPGGTPPKEPLRKGIAKRNGVKRMVANGAKMDNLGKKKVRLKRDGCHEVNSITFQVSDVGKPLASVSRILGKGGRVVFRGFDH